jgi:hypothetical protein
MYGEGQVLFRILCCLAVSVYWLVLMEGLSGASVTLPLVRLLGKMNPIHTLPSCFQNNHKKRNLEPEIRNVNVFVDSARYCNRGNENAEGERA